MERQRGRAIELLEVTEKNVGASASYFYFRCGKRKQR